MASVGLVATAASVPASSGPRIRGVLLVEADLRTVEIVFAAPGALVNDPPHERAALIRFVLGVGAIKNNIGAVVAPVQLNPNREEP